MYVVAREWGHQNLTGITSQIDRHSIGASSDSVRRELQADCLAGAWAGDASTPAGKSGQTFLASFTDAELASALCAAATVGDDASRPTRTGSRPRRGPRLGRAAQGVVRAGDAGRPPAGDTFDSAAGGMALTRGQARAESAVDPAPAQLLAALVGYPSRAPRRPPDPAALLAGNDALQSLRGLFLADVAQWARRRG